VGKDETLIGTSLEEIKLEGNTAKPIGVPASIV
jgi:hypothetical protein